MSKVCAICGAPAECTHHLVFGRGIRPLADADNLTIDCCNACHNMAQQRTEQIHENSSAEKLSKMLGQMKFERDFIAEHNGELLKQARNAFIERYGKNYL